jgi:hypothetical protein
VKVTTEPDVVIPDELTGTASAVPKACTTLEVKLPTCIDILIEAVQSEAVRSERVPEPLAMDSLNVTLMLLDNKTPVASVVGLTEERVGAAVSIVIDNAEDREDVLPAASACTVVISHTPSASDGKVHVAPEVLPDIWHAWNTPAFSARTVTVPPFSAAVTEIVGVLSLVMLSVLDDPVSDPATKSGVLVASGATVSVIKALRIG